MEPPAIALIVHSLLKTIMVCAEDSFRIAGCVGTSKRNSASDNDNQSENSLHDQFLFIEFQLSHPSEPDAQALRGDSGGTLSH